MYRLPPELGLSDPGETLRPPPYHRDGLKVAALKCSSLGATNSSRGDGGRCPLYEFSVEFSLLFEPEDWGVEEEDDDEEEVKFIPDSSGGFVAVFCPVKLFLHTGQVSCWRKQKVLLVALLAFTHHPFTPGFKLLINIYSKHNKRRIKKKHLLNVMVCLPTCSSQGTMQSLWNMWLHGSCLTFSPTL